MPQDQDDLPAAAPPEDTPTAAAFDEAFLPPRHPPGSGGSP
jgi:hypothetical protein